MKTAFVLAALSAMLLPGCSHPEPRYSAVPAYSAGVISRPIASPPAPALTVTPPPPTYAPAPAPTTPAPETFPEPSPATRAIASTDADRELVTTVQHLFDRYGDLSALMPNIQVAAQNGIVTLTGSVPGEREKQMIDAMVRNTRGVLSVNNQLRISGPGATVVSDRALETEVRQTLRAQADLAAALPTVQIAAQNGVVTLTGTVPNPDARQSIENLVRNTPGVVTVNDQLQVSLQPTGRSDQPGQTEAPAAGQVFNLNVEGAADADRALAQQITEALRADSTLASMLPTVQINVAQGKVTVQGTVQNEQQRQTIISAIQRAAGEQNVYNDLRIQPVNQ